MAKIYLDMDGVLADFNKALRLHGLDGSSAYYSRDRSTWTAGDIEHDRRCNEIMDSDDFWPNIPIMPGAFELITAAATRADTYILTATPRNTEKREQCAKQKTEWAVKNLHFPAHKVITCLRSEKQQFATDSTLGRAGFLVSGPNLLVDDTPKNCEEWTHAGGIAWLHTSIAGSINALKGLNL